MTIDPITIDPADVYAASERIEHLVLRTPLLRSPVLDELAGGTILLKPECLQRTGSFKIRGAANRLLSMTDAERERGVVAWSSGNHALAVSEVARLLGLDATIVMPADAPAPKRRGVEASGAHLVLYDRATQSREEIGTALAEKSGGVIVRPFDDPAIMAGQGTVGLEVVQQCAELGLAPDALAVAASGGGLAAGVATAIDAESPGTSVYTVEPTDFDDVARSLRAGHRVGHPPGASTICDALQAPMPGELTFPVLHERGVTGLVVSEQEVRDAVRFAFETLRLVVEPGGAVALAAALAGRLPLKDRTTVLVLSGGNIEPGLLAATITA